MANGLAREDAVQVTNWKARTFGILATVAGCLGAGLSGNLQPKWLADTALAISTTLVSTGALSLFFELALRRNVYDEMMRLVGINRGVTSQQLIGAGPVNALDWHEIYRSKAELTFLLINPQSWVEQNIPTLFENAKQRPTNITFFFPDPLGDYFTDLATAVGSTKEAFSYSVTESASRIEAAWKDLRDRGQLVKGSKIKIRFLPERPLYSLVTCDDMSVVQITGVIGRFGADVDYFYRHVGSRDAFPDQSPAELEAEYRGCLNSLLVPRRLGQVVAKLGAAESIHICQRSEFSGYVAPQIPRDASAALHDWGHYRDEKFDWLYHFIVSKDVRNAIFAITLPGSDDTKYAT